MTEQKIEMYEGQRWQFWIDVGGTFTDCVALSPLGEIRTHKTLSSGKIKSEIASRHANVLRDSRKSVNTENFWKGWSISIFDEQNRLLCDSIVVRSVGNELHLKDEIPKTVSVGDRYELSSQLEAPLVCIRSILGLAIDEPLPDLDVRMGTTRGTNALLERKGARTAFLVTQGFKDLLLIGNQDRPELFDLNIKKPAPLYETALEVEERLAADGTILTSINIEDLKEKLNELKADGIESVAIAFLHAYQNPEHELIAEQLARETDFQEVSRSSHAASSIKIVPRAETTVLDAYLTPVLRSYLANIRTSLTPESSLKLMTSFGGLVDGELFTGKDCILSGPAGGVVAFSKIGESAGFRHSIGFDMGGTSTDVSRYGGEFEIQTETTKAGVRIASPTLAIETVAAGGGSICRFDGVQLQVGPESAGADPGPACYGRGGPLTITDANVALGRVIPEQFPFPLDVAAVNSRIDETIQAIKAATGQVYTREELAQGFIDIANETMARAIRNVSIRKGYHPQDHLLVSFGGAGGQHACAMARSLGMQQILIHPFAGILSAYGMGLAEIRKREEMSLLKPLSSVSTEKLQEIYAELKTRLSEEIRKEGISSDQIESVEFSLSLRYAGLESTILLKGQPGDDFAAAYHREHERLYGYQHPERPVDIVSVTMEVVGKNAEEVSPALTATSKEGEHSEHPKTFLWHNRERLETPVLFRQHLQPGMTFQGPTIICDSGSTIWIEPDFSCQIQSDGSLLLTQAKPAHPELSSRADAAEQTPDLIQLEIFNNQFASIAEQMGVTLKNTSISTNVKERLDYSCAIFDERGGLVVNAPHIPVHLGAMGETVKTLLKDCPDWKPGDVFITNDPYAGGSHLPDVTVVTPVHDQLTEELLFITASRAHHAEIGGIRPGSMPPFSKNLAEEGVLIRRFKLVEQGISQETELRELLLSGPFPTRNVEDNIADIAAQVAANKMGAKLLLKMVASQGKRRILSYMHHIQKTACKKMKLALSLFGNGRYQWKDYLDDGSPICVEITINGDRAKIDFSGTGPVLQSNLNANRAIVTAACMYVFRCLIEETMPLNSGVLEPLEIVLPECLLNPPKHDDPTQCAAMVGGNVETSQRVVDVLLGALGQAAASQGTMNNLTFGNETFGYYETICGGAGATAQQGGADAVHTHMTNTRLTDVEVIEHRYPVRIREFKIRSNSGGNGTHNGGEGISRTFEFLEPIQVSLLTQRRGKFPPFGIEGGSDGAIGRNLLKRNQTDIFEDVGGCVQLDLDSGDQLTIETPGGGGFGAV